MGSPDGTGESDEHPQHKVSLDAFWIDQTDVTNEMYALCVKAGACQSPSQTKSWSGTSYYGNALFDHYPVIYVDWDQANTYCQWVGAHLPSEAQWEKAARGTDGRIYPWGNSWPTCPLVNFSGCSENATKVDAHSPGASPYGVFDMAGNVWQWVEDWYDSGYYASSPLKNPTGPSSGQYHVQRGGSFNNDINEIRSFNRAGDNQPDGGANVGFRCACPST